MTTTESQLGMCTFDGCCNLIGRHGARGFCPKHYVRWQRHGDAGRADVVHGGAAGYTGAHARAYRKYGAASAHLCRHCGDRAYQWAYDHDDPYEAIDDRRGFAYSQDPDHYMPLCVSCHRRFDAEHRTEIEVT